MFVCVCACSLYVNFGLHCSVTAAKQMCLIHFKAVIQYEVGSNRPTSLTQLTLSGVIHTSVLGYVTVQECPCANICFKPMKHSCMSKGAAMRSGLFHSGSELPKHFPDKVHSLYFPFANWRVTCRQLQPQQWREVSIQQCHALNHTLHELLKDIYQNRLKSVHTCSVHQPKL